MNERGRNLLGALAIAITDDIDQRMTAPDLPRGSAAAAVVSIDAYDMPSIDMLSRVLELTHSSTVRLVDRLQNDGLVDRLKGKGQRSVHLCLTASGRRVLERLHAARRSALERHLSTLTPQEQEALFGLVEKMLALPRQADEANHVCRFCDTSTCPADVCPVDCTAD